MNNLKDCVRSTRRMASSAATVITSRSVRESQIGSEIGVEMTENQRRRIEQWLPELTIFEGNQSEDVFSSSSASSVSKESRQTIPIQVKTSDISVSERISELLSNDPGHFDLEFEIIQHMRESAAKKFASQEYTEAENILFKILKRSETNFGPEYAWRAETTRMLATVYWQTNKWEEAEKVMREEWIERDKNMEMLAIALFQHGKWDEAENILHEILNDLMENSPQELQVMHLLGEINLAKSNLKVAENWAVKAIRGRKLIFGNDILFYESVNLLSQIYEAQEESTYAEAYKALLPRNFERILFSKAND
jgi:Tetratricopeptide repeat